MGQICVCPHKNSVCSDSAINPLHFHTSPQRLHRILNDYIVRRPNIWVFLRVLKDQQALSENTFEAVRRGELPPRRRKKWRNLEERLQELKRQYNTGARNLDQFWSALTYLVPHP
ncbi:hypothetical protein ACOMHN_067003 [Nucella lapillus]